MPSAMVAPPPLSEEDVEVLRKARASAAAAGTLSLVGGGYGASALVLPKLSLRPRVGGFEGGGGGGGGMAAAAAAAAPPPPPPVSPAVVEATSRGLATGARAAAYGSALALAGVALGSLWAARSMVSSSSTGGGDGEGNGGQGGVGVGGVGASSALKETLSPLGDAAREMLGPVASWARREIGGEGAGGELKGKRPRSGGGGSSDAAGGEFSASLGRRLDASKRKWASRAGIGSD